MHPGGQHGGSIGLQPGGHDDLQPGGQRGVSVFGLLDDFLQLLIMAVILRPPPPLDSQEDPEEDEDCLEWLVNLCCSSMLVSHELELASLPYLLLPNELVVGGLYAGPAEGGGLNMGLPP